MTPTFDTSRMTMTEIIRLQTQLSQALARRFERPAALAFTDIVESSSYFTHFGDEAGQRLQHLHYDLLEQSMGGESTPSRAVVQSAGQGLRLRASVIKQEFQQAGPAMHLLLRYTQALITQMAQTAVCNRHHSLDQQLCRWLLLSLDRLQGNELVMTQELIANMRATSPCTTV